MLIEHKHKVVHISKTEHTTKAGDEQLDMTEFEQGLYNHCIMGI